ncbi:nucleotidyl transferase [Hamiltosporidium magnivora]|uniref:mannose-1-phosphate guanylyltransferase n=1 Tax=Hamiltosporidium magnivora TaxID=148818 RepID=A0A4Q9L9L2_9MICR|nr:nucleotidyl transferase [Hamiltosporidium magnivora]
MAIRTENIKALILVGGYGTRLRPLTLTTPKPLVPFANKPIIQHQIQALKKSGVKEIILAMNFEYEAIIQEVRTYTKQFGVKIHFSLENTPLGTAGPVSLASKYLQDCRVFYVLNSDIICEFPLIEMMKNHLESKCEGTILTTVVENPKKYGVITTVENTSLIDSFKEKPEEYFGNRINAGIYIFDVSVLQRLEIKNISMEKEIFPKMANEKKLNCYELKGFWMDIGQPKDYLIGQSLYLKYLKIPENTIMNESCKIGEGCKIGPNVVIGNNVTIGNYVCIQNSTIFDGCVIGDGCFINNSIISWECDIGKWCRIEECTVLGHKVVVDDCFSVIKCMVLPFKRINENLFDRILM